MQKQYILAGLLCLILVPFDKTYAMEAPTEHLDVVTMDKEGFLNWIMKTYTFFSDEQAKGYLDMLIEDHNEPIEQIAEQEIYNNQLSKELECAKQLEQSMGASDISTIASMPDASIEVQEFVRDELKKIELKNYENIKIKLTKPSDSNSPACAVFNTILLTPSAAYKIEMDLKRVQNPVISEKEKQKILARINCSRGMIQHEGGHIKHQHASKRVPLYCISACIFFYIGFTLLDPQYLSTKCFSAILIWMLSLRASGLLSSCYSRIEEQQADDTVIDDEAILEQMVKHFTHDEKPENQSSDFWDKHPADWKRAKRYQERLDTLRK